ncbi:hypothetical protein [Rhodocyclus tenuis]|uniref:hypothetical protein n=1 Tax=Rhodocyclus tenuis TaxID=1066 RepID=UPI0019088D7E|nr:hypothetical protein [Rhodocyclus tenuis]MBK1681682.1 hypothetical protein [Rhodocyclus tenuis]
MLPFLPGVPRWRALPAAALAVCVLVSSPQVAAQMRSSAAGETREDAANAVRTLTLTLSERPVRVDVHAPAGKGRDAIVLAHGFMRTRASLAGHAAALAEAGYLTVASDLPYGVSARDNGEALGDLLALMRAGALGMPVERIVLAGFSAGALAALFAAVNTPDLAGYIALDPVDFPDREGLAAAHHLQIPAVLLHGPPSACNVFRMAAPWAAAMPDLREERLIENASHCDFESPTDGVCTHLCGATTPERQAAVRAALLRAAAALLPPR